MYKFCSLFSGSSGNSTYIGTESEGVLIDAGKNAKQITLALNEIGVAPESIKALFVTHEHIDHIGALRVFCNKYKIPVYASLATLEYLDSHGHLDGDFEVFQMDSFATIGDFNIECFRTMHDVPQSQGYTVTLPNGIKTAVVTDLGVMTDDVFDAIKGAKTILLESNHDAGMLLNGPYPYALKRRIYGERGHLSNDATAATAAELLKSGTEHFLLGHLSEENNIPELAFQTTVAKLFEDDAHENEDYTLKVANRHSPTSTEV